MNTNFITLKRLRLPLVISMIDNPSDDSSAPGDDEDSAKSTAPAGLGSSSERGEKPKRKKDFRKNSKQDRNEGKWDSMMSNSPDLSRQKADSPIKYRPPVLVDTETGVITPSLVLRFANIFPAGIKYSMYRDYWFNNEYLGKLERAAVCYNGSDSPVNAEYIGNYFRGVIDILAIYIQLSSIQLLDERMIRGEFDSDAKFKASVRVLSDFFKPSKFRKELSLLKQAVEQFYLPPVLLQLAEQTYSPKFSKFAGIRTVELMSIVYPVHPSLLCYTEGQRKFDVSQYKEQNKELVSLFIDEYFWSDIKGEVPNLSLPRNGADRITNFIRHTRTCLEDSFENENGEFFGLHEIMATVLPEYSLRDKLKENYGVVPISEGGRFARINNSQNYICKPFYSQDEIQTIYSVYSQRKEIKELFGSINFGVSMIPAIEGKSTYTDTGSGGRSTQGAIYSLTFDQFPAYHSKRGSIADLSGMEVLRTQFGYEGRESINNSDSGDVYFSEDTIQPGLIVKIPDRNGGSWLYTIEEDYTNVLKNIVNLKPEAYRWFNSIEQPRYSILRIEEGANVVNSKLVSADGQKIEGVEVEPVTINDSELVACYFDLNSQKYRIGEIIKEIWNSRTLIERVVKYPNGPTDSYIRNIN